MKKLLCALCAGVAFLSLGLRVAKAWSLEEASKDYKGTEIKVIFLDRPGYRATIKMLPEFEQKTGIKVSYDIVPYESTREKEVLDFSAQGDLSIALVDLVWCRKWRCQRPPIGVSGQGFYCQVSIHPADG
jgi:multiple sugar transport system substrate-binding protein